MVFCAFRAAVAVLGAMYEKLGRMMGGSFPETIQGLLKALKNAEVKNIKCLDKVFGEHPSCIYLWERID